MTTDEIMALADQAAEDRHMCGSPTYNAQAAQSRSALKQAIEALAKDAARFDWLVEHRAYVVSDPICCDGFWLHFVQNDGRTWVQATEHATPREAIDKAIEAAQAEQHDN